MRSFKRSGLMGRVNIRLFPPQVLIKNRLSSCSTERYCTFSTGIGQLKSAGYGASLHIRRDVSDAWLFKIIGGASFPTDSSATSDSPESPWFSCTESFFALHCCHHSSPVPSCLLFPWWVGEWSHGRYSETLNQRWYAVTAVEAGRGGEPQAWLTQTGEHWPKPERQTPTRSTLDFRDPSTIVFFPSHRIFAFPGFLLVTSTLLSSL